MKRLIESVAMTTIQCHKLFIGFLYLDTLLIREEEGKMPGFNRLISKLLISKIDATLSFFFSTNIDVTFFYLNSGELNPYICTMLNNSFIGHCR